MIHSLEIIDGGHIVRDKDTQEVIIDANGTFDLPLSFEVIVDGVRNNLSFEIYSTNGEWFDYEIERNDTSVNVIVKIRRNLSTDIRLGTLVIEHNCSNIIKYIHFVQNGLEYSLTASYDDGWIFSSTPKDLFEEKSITLEATNGRGQWYLKEIQQYQTMSDDNFNDLREEYTNNETQNKRMSQIRVPYDGVFNCRKDGNKFNIKSFGQIDLVPKSNGHMRYFFVFSHIDVNSSNNSMLDLKGITYEKRMLLVFDRKDMSGYTQ